MVKWCLAVKKGPFFNKNNNLSLIRFQVFSKKKKKRKLKKETPTFLTILSKCENMWDIFFLNLWLSQKNLNL